MAVDALMREALRQTRPGRLAPNRVGGGLHHEEMALAVTGEDGEPLLDDAAGTLDEVILELRSLRYGLGLMLAGQHAEAAAVLMKGDLPT